jgi:hypothetical protein
MPEITIKAIEQLLDAKLEPIITKLDAVEETLSDHTTVLHGHTSTLNNHTSILDALSKDVKTLLDDKTVTAHRIERIEHWAQMVGEKLGIKLEI